MLKGIAYSQNPSPFIHVFDDDKTKMKITGKIEMIMMTLMITITMVINRSGQNPKVGKIQSHPAFLFRKSAQALLCDLCILCP